MPEPGSQASRFLGRLWTQTITEPLARIDRESRAFLATDASRRIDAKVVTVLVTAAVSLTLIHYSSIPWLFAWLADLLRAAGLETVVTAVDQVVYRPANPTDAVVRRANQELNGLTSWSLGCIVCYLFLPLLVIRVGFRERVRDYGVKFSGAFTDWWIYVVMLVIMVPLLLLASSTAHFLNTYPYYKIQPGEPLWPNFWRWEVLYAAQFFSLEFSFRGFMVHGLKHRFGVYAIFAMMVPYCMIHIVPSPKPLPETLGSIVAGIVLGFMSLKTRSIWLGTAIHVSVALGMDFAALWRKGLLTGW